MKCRDFIGTIGCRERVKTMYWYFSNVMRTENEKGAATSKRERELDGRAVGMGVCHIVIIIKMEGTA